MVGPNEVKRKFIAASLSASVFAMLVATEFDPLPREYYSFLEQSYDYAAGVFFLSLYAFPIIFVYGISISMGGEMYFGKLPALLRYPISGIYHVLLGGMFGLIFASWLPRLQRFCRVLQPCSSF
ncbi:hypothetical protein [Effusibacillus lacus]|uniref:hypothetical protein n=1 Tax=Effusibacillus lacus TaxID=1348429 RepID=UPI000BB7161D|nr:hypothetical protein [Effusibacillus lacus]TCS70064.1 hypothetical protein EDD64_13428 [Effusibacillus lacus]